MDRTIERAEEDHGGIRETGSEELWIETPRGYLFFINALLVAPPVMVLIPLALRALLRARGALEGPSEFLDPFPMVAAHVLPTLGWLLVLPIALLVWNLRIEPARGPRAALLAFLLVHAGFLSWTVWGWVT